MRVGDASLVVGVCNQLLNPATREEYTRTLKADNGIRKRYLELLNNRARLVPLKTARAQSFKTDWATAEIAVPKKLGVQVMHEIPLTEIAPCILIGPRFFGTWELKGILSQNPHQRKVGQAGHGIV